MGNGECPTRDAGWCDLMDEEAAVDYAEQILCDKCTLEEERNAARLTRDFYLRKVASLEVTIKELRRDNEFLKREVARKGEQMEFLR